MEVYFHYALFQAQRFNEIDVVDKVDTIETVDESEKFERLKRKGGFRSQ